MKQIAGGLMVGSEEDYAGAKGLPNVSYVLAARDPWLREIIGFTGRAAPV